VSLEINQIAFYVPNYRVATYSTTQTI